MRGTNSSACCSTYDCTYCSSRRSNGDYSSGTADRHYSSGTAHCHHCGGRAHRHHRGEDFPHRRLVG